MFAVNVVSGQFAQAELGGIVAHAIKPQFPAQFLKVKIVALGQRLGHVHAEASQLHRRVARDQPFRKRGHGNGELDGGAGFSARRKRQLLIDHGQDAPVGRVDYHGGAVHIAQGIDGRLPDHWILARRYVACADGACDKGVGRKPFVGLMAATLERGAAHANTNA